MFQYTSFQIEPLAVSFLAKFSAVGACLSDLGATNCCTQWTVSAVCVMKVAVAENSLANLQVVYYKRLRAVEFVDKVPKTASGKILRKELRAKVAARSATSNL